MESNVSDNWSTISKHKGSTFSHSLTGCNGVENTAPKSLTQWSASMKQHVNLTLMLWYEQPKCQLELGDPQQWVLKGQQKNVKWHWSAQLDYNHHKCSQHLGSNKRQDGSQHLKNNKHNQNRSLTYSNWNKGQVVPSAMSTMAMWVQQK